MKSINKRLALILVAFLAISRLPLYATAETLSDKTSAVSDVDAYAITSPSEFMAMDAGGSYYLANDINFEDVTVDTPYLVETFYGTINGNGYAIKNVTLEHTVSNEESINVGVFGNIGDASSVTSISNLKIDNITLTFDDTAENLNNESNTVSLGFLAGATKGDARKVVITDVHVACGSINAEPGARSCSAVGGLVGVTSGISVSDCTVDGAIVATASSSADICVGGVVGLALARDGVKSVINSCVNNANVTLAYKDGINATEFSAVGGLIGITEMMLTVTGGSNNADLATTAIVGGILGYNRCDTLVVIADSTVEAGSIYGEKALNSRLCVVGCKVGASVSDQNSSFTPITDVDEFKELNGKDGFYRLANDIDFGGTVQSESIVSDFSGVLYGDGKILKNLKFNADKGVALFDKLSEAKASAILNLDIGTVSVPVDMTVNAGGNVAVLAAESGDYNVEVCDVDIFADLKVVSDVDVNVAGFLSNVGGFDILNSNMYGNVELTLNTNGKTFCIGGFVAVAKNTTVGAEFINCNNLARVTHTGVDNDTQSTAAGFLARSVNRSTYTVDCVNFGTVEVSSNCSDSRAGGFIGFMSYGHVIVNDCVNFGNITGDFCGSAIGAFDDDVTDSLKESDTQDTVGSTVNTFVDYGTVSATKSFGNVYVNFVGNDDGCVNCSVSSVAEMNKGASVRIDSESTALRYRATVSLEAIEFIENRIGNGTVSCGTIIAPLAFVTAAGDDCTVETLDYLKQTNPELFNNGTNGYIDIEATLSSEGIIDGPMNDVEGLCEDKFVGRAYIRINVEDNGVLDLYAKYYDGDMANNTRSVKDVVVSARDDLLYKKSNTYYKLVDGGYQQITDSSVVAQYKTSVGTHEGYVKYSCYTKDDHDGISRLASKILNASEQGDPSAPADDSWRDILDKLLQNNKGN